MTRFSYVAVAGLLVVMQAAAQPLATKVFNPNPVAPGGRTTITFDVSNPSTTVTLTGVTFTDNLMGGLIVASPNNINGFCTGGSAGVANGNSGGTTTSLLNTTLVPSSHCTYNIDVIAPSTPGPIFNTTGPVQSSAGLGTPGTATLIVLSPPAITKSFAPATIGVGGSSTLTFTVSNPNAATALTGISFTDTLPAGVVVSTPNGLTGSCGGGVITATAGSGSVSLATATLAGGASCTFSVNVTATTVGVKNNAVTVSSTTAGNGNTASATLTVLAPPTITKAFGAGSININGITTLTFTLANPNAGTALTGAAFTDTLPAGLVVAGIPGVTNTCGGTVVAVGGTNVISLTGGTIPAGGSCTISVNVAGVAAGLQTNVTSTLTTTNGGTGSPATAVITVLPIIEAEAAYQLRYLANLDKGDSYVNFTNAGTLNGFDPAGRICVNVYTFDPAEELISCCACPVTPNGLNSLSARNDLISNTLTPGVPTSITVKLVASVPIAGVCNAAAPTAATVVRGMRAWATTLHLNTAALPAPGVYQHTETPFSTAELSVSELAKLTSFCGFIQANGSGFGICKSCRSGGLGGDQK